MTRTYIAARLSNWPTVRHVMTILRGHGVEITHDWTEDAERWFAGPVFRPTALDPMFNAALAEAVIEAIWRSDVVVFIGPGRRGAHVELGAALASGTRVVMVPGDEPEEYPCPFHHHPGVERVETVERAIWAVLGVRVEDPEVIDE